MESYLTVSLVAVLFATIIWQIIQWVTERKNFHQTFIRMGVPGPEPSLISGNANHIRPGNKLPIEVMDEWDRKFGQTYGYFSGIKPMLVLRDLELVKQVLIKDFSNFANRPKMMIEVKPVIDTLVGMRGQRWKDARSILSPTFSMNKLKHMSHIVNRAIGTLVEILDSKVSQNEEFDIFKMFQGLTCDVIGECALAMKVDCQRNPDDIFLKSVRQFLDNAINPAIIMASYFPIVQTLMGYLSKNMSISGYATKTVCENVSRVIKQRRENATEGRKIDVLQLMLDASEATQTSEAETSSTVSTKKLLSDDEIVANSWIFLLGGFETTANALTFMCFLLAKNPDVQDKLYQEISENIEDPDHPDYDSIQQLKYLDMAFNESMRIYPPVALFVVRECEDEFKLGDVTIPSGMNIQIPVWQIHHDPNIWPDPFKFDPERFSPENKKDHHPMAFIPFGAGPRNCIGMRFALLESKLALVRILSRFRLIPSENTEDNPKIKIPTVAINPVNGMPLRAMLR